MIDATSTENASPPKCAVKRYAIVAAVVAQSAFAGGSPEIALLK
jgi:hypothetical protein